MPSSLIFVLLCSASQPLEIHVDGEGWLRFEREGRAVYARDAKLSVFDGRLVNEQGLSLLPSLSASNLDGAQANLEGRILIQGKEIGRLVLAKFPLNQEPSEVKQMWVATERPTLGSAGEGVFGVIRMGKRLPSGANPPKAQPQGPPPQSQPLQSQPPQSQPPQSQPPKTQPPQSQSPNQPQSGQPAAQPNPKPIPPVKAPAVGPLVIQVKALGSAEGEMIKLSDIAELTGLGSEKAGAITLSSTPAHGIDRPISQSLVESRLTSSGFPRGTWQLVWPSAKVAVRRLGQEIAHEAFVSAGKTALVKLLPFGSKIDAEGTAPPMACPLGAYELIALEPKVERDRIRLQVEVWFQGTRFNARPLTFKITSPTTGIKVGQEIQVRVRSGGASVIAKGKVRQIDQMNGQVTVEMDKGVTLTVKPGQDGVFEVAL